MEVELSRLLERAGAGEREALDGVVDLLYDDLRRRARAQIARRSRSASGPVTLPPTALVHEAYLRLIRQRTRFADRDHFLAIATKLMARALADHHKAKERAKRGGGAVRVTLTGLPCDPGTRPATVGTLADALKRLEAMDARKANVVKLRAIWGFDIEETAKALNISVATVERDWRFAKAWLFDELRGEA